MSLKINLGSGRKKIDGFINLDGLEWEGNTQIKQDLTVFPWYYSENVIIEDDSVDYILCEEVLEHISFRKTLDVLQECYRILKPGGALHIQVPDIGRMCEYYVKGLICECCPRKTLKIKDFHGKEDCPICEGKAKINPERFWFAFSGAQKHKFDNHLNHFNQDRLLRLLTQAGFKSFNWNNNIYKLKVTAIK